MKTEQCQYLRDVLNVTFRQIQNGDIAAYSPDRAVELEDAITGIDDLFTVIAEHLDRQKALIVALEEQIERLERRIDRQAAR